MIQPDSSSNRPLRHWVLFLCACTAVFLSPMDASAGQHGRRAAPKARFLPLVCDTLYLGTATPSGELSEADWQGFLETVVTQRFPEGLTVYEAYGQWKNPQGVIVRERTRVLQLLHRQERRYDSAIKDLVGTYKQMFGQESVLWVRSTVKASF
jgi:hypothetical protein